MIAGILLFLALPLAVGTVVYALRRWATMSALLSTGTALALGVAIVVLPLGRTVELWGRTIVMGGTVTFLGRELVLEEVDRIAIAVLYLTAAGLFALSWQASPGSMLFPIGLGILSLLSGSLLIRPLIYAVLLLELAIALSILALQTEGWPPTHGGLQYLSFALLAMPGLLVIHWLMDRFVLTPDDTGLLDAAAILLALSFALLVGSIPFHLWMPSVAGDSDPLASAFVFTVNNGAVWFLLLAFLDSYPDLSAYTRLGPFVSGVGLVMIGVGGVLAASQRSLGRLMGYSALIDSGVALTALGLETERGLALALLSVLARPFGLSLMAAGLSGLPAEAGAGAKLDAVRGLGWRTPWSALAFLVGGLSMAGWPATVGFGARWALYRAIAPSDLPAVLLMMLASVGVMVGVWRGAAGLFWRPPSLTAGGDQVDGGTGSEGVLKAVLIVAASAVCLGAGLFPQFLASTALRLAGLYAFLPP
ncbi:MAG: proton-conducting transporter membrane subunit [Anaerolineae bacterium]